MFQPENWLYALSGVVLVLTAIWTLGIAMKLRPRQIKLKSALCPQDSAPQVVAESANTPSHFRGQNWSELPRQSPNNKLARLHALRQGKTVTGPRGEELYMVASECIVFRGTASECYDFLSARGIIPFASAIEPLDVRIDDNLALLGVGVVDNWSPRRISGS